MSDIEKEDLLEPGKSYESKQVAILLTRTSHSDDFLDPAQREYFLDTIRKADRIKTSLIPSNHIYNGSWFEQGLEPTCLPFAIVNAIHILGGTFDFMFIAELLNKTNIAQEKEYRGMHYKDPLDILLKYTDLDVLMFQLSDIDQLQRTDNSTFEQIARYHSFSKSMSNFFESESSATDTDNVTPEQEWQEIQNKNVEKIISNASLIKENLDQGIVLLTNVPNNYDGYKPRIVNLHAICIVGYKVNESGSMDVQILDPGRGKIWMSV